ncbi:MAG: DUF6515 family protein [Gammaproteobacteria bacterium]|nr:DUF6515 family protein [Gammaproteobacteria bacterium]
MPKPAVLILILLSCFTIPAVSADPRSPDPAFNNQAGHHKFKKESAGQENHKWRDTIKYNKSEMGKDDSNRPDTIRSSRDSGHTRQNQFVKEKPHSRQQHVNNQRKNDDNSQHEARELKKPPQHSTDPREYKDKKYSRPDSHNHAGEDHESQSRHDRNEHDEHRHYREHREEHVIVKHESKHNAGHRLNYNLYNRHQHIYYRTPWYNTRYIAPIHYHYHPVGYHMHVLPKTHVRIIVSGNPYFFFGGVFYQSFNNGYVVVSAPIGALVHTLPVGFIAFSLGLSTYYFVNDTYYIWDEPRQAYAVVEKPAGTDDAITEATSGRLFIYPKEGQSEEQQAKDRYECHRWAVTESRIDPTLEDEDYSNEQKRDYQRAIAACLEGRGYTVN